MRTPVILLVAAVSAIAACDAQTAPSASRAPPPIETTPATLSLVPASSGAGEAAVDLVYAPARGTVAPRMLELHVDYAGAEYVDAEPLAAVTAAHKELVVQDEGASLRIIIYAATNTSTLAAGPLAHLVFRHPAAGASVSLEDRRPIFAPAAANDGIVLGEPLELSGGAR